MPRSKAIAASFAVPNTPKCFCFLSEQRSRSALIISGAKLEDCCACYEHAFGKIPEPAGAGAKKDWLVEQTKEYRNIVHHDPVEYEELPDLLCSAERMSIRVDVKKEQINRERAPRLDTE